MQVRIDGNEVILPGDLDAMACVKDNRRVGAAGDGGGVIEEERANEGGLGRAWGLGLGGGEHGHAEADGV